jgi:hypothetical protein
MIISHKLKCIYIKIPKTGSTSVENYFRKIDPTCTSSDNDGPPPFGHFTASELREMVTEEQWKNYFKFTIIRNPEKQVLSEYIQNAFVYTWPDWPDLRSLLGSEGHLRHPYLNKVSDVDFIQFLALKALWFEPRHCYQQVDWINEDLDFIGKLENKEDWAYIQKKLGLKEEDLPRDNSTKEYLGDDYRPLSFGKKAKDMFNVIYKEDIELYNKEK